MNECFTDPIFGNFSVERKKVVKEGIRKRKEKRLRERLVSYSVNLHAFTKACKKLLLNKMRT